jgi:hypothetical protein
MSSANKLKLPEIRLLTPEENQQLTDIAEDIAQHHFLVLFARARAQQLQSCSSGEVRLPPRN